MIDQDDMSAVSYPIELLHLTDPHILPDPTETLIGVDTSYYLDAVLKLAVNSGLAYDLCLITGDLVQTPLKEAYHRLLGILERYDLDFNCLPGNHDDSALMRDILFSPTVKCERQLFLGNWQIICLDSSLAGSDAGYLAAVELDFLARCLTNNPDLFGLVAVHHHAVPSGSEWMDSMIIGNADELLELLGGFPQAKLLINGHIHQQMETSAGGLRVLTTPSSCFQFAPHSRDFRLDSAMPGYRSIQLHSDGSVFSSVTRLSGTIDGLQSGIQGY